MYLLQSRNVSVVSRRNASARTLRFSDYFLLPVPRRRALVPLSMPSNPRKHKDRAIYDNYTRRCAEQAGEHVLETAEQIQFLPPGAELASRHNSCVTMTPKPQHARHSACNCAACGGHCALHMLHMLHAAHVARHRGCMLGGLVCAQSPSATARDGSAERIHLSRRHR